MELSKDYLLSQLYKVNPTEDSLKSLALYIRTFKHEHALIAEGIAYVHSKSSIHHRLLLFYLVNEILQTERAPAGQPLRHELKAFLSQHFIADLNSSMAGSSISKKLAALQCIWKSRNIIDLDAPDSRQA